jgi:non-heme chloroperoxidase
LLPAGSELAGGGTVSPVDVPRGAAEEEFAMPMSAAVPPPAIVRPAPTPVQVALPGRVTLSVVEQGPRDGLPVVLLHGITDSWWSWAEVLPLLPSTWRVLAPSQRGHGDSESPTAASAYAVTEFARDVVALLDARGIDRAVVVGHSMGGTVAERVALLAPGRVRAVVLVGASATWAGHPGVLELQQAVAALTDPVPAAFADEFQKSTIARPVSPAFYDGVLRETAKVKAHVWRGAVAGLLAEDSSAALASVAAPTLLLWGDQDSFADAAVRDGLVKAMPRAAHRTMAGYGHALHWEAPAAVAAALRDFVGGLPAR